MPPGLNELVDLATTAVDVVLAMLTMLEDEETSAVLLTTAVATVDEMTVARVVDTAAMAELEEATELAAAEESELAAAEESELAAAEDAAGALW